MAANSKILLRRVGHGGNSYDETVEVAPSTSLSFDDQGNAISAAGGSDPDEVGGTGVKFFSTADYTDPNNNLKGLRPCIAYNVDTGAMWLKTGSGNNKTGWVERV